MKYLRKCAKYLSWNLFEYLKRNYFILDLIKIDLCLNVSKQICFDIWNIWSWKYSSCLEFRAAPSHNMFGSVAQFMWRPSVAHNLRLCFSTSPALFTKRKILLWFPAIMFLGVAFSLFFYACFSKLVFFNLVLWELNSIQLHIWNIIIYYYYLNMKYEEQAKDKEKVKVLRIGYKTVSQTMGNQKQKEKRTGNTKRKSAELVIEV